MTTYMLQDDAVSLAMKSLPQAYFMANMQYSTLAHILNKFFFFRLIEQVFKNVKYGTFPNLDFLFLFHCCLNLHEAMQSLKQVVQHQLAGKTKEHFQMYNLVTSIINVSFKRDTIYSMYKSAKENRWQ